MTYNVFSGTLNLTQSRQCVPGFSVRVRVWVSVRVSIRVSEFFHVSIRLSIRCQAAVQEELSYTPQRNDEIRMNRRQPVPAEVDVQYRKAVSRRSV